MIEIDRAKLEAAKILASMLKKELGEAVVSLIDTIVELDDDQIATHSKLTTLEGEKERLEQKVAKYEITLKYYAGENTYNGSAARRALGIDDQYDSYCYYEAVDELIEAEAKNTKLLKQVEGYRDAIEELLIANGDPSTPPERMDEVFDNLEILIYGSLEAAHEANEKRLNQDTEGKE